MGEDTHKTCRLSPNKDVTSEGSYSKGTANKGGGYCTCANAESVLPATLSSRHQRETPSKGIIATNASSKLLAVR
jgi:hypothetical protein